MHRFWFNCCNFFGFYSEFRVNFYSKNGFVWRNFALQVKKPFLPFALIVILQHLLLARTVNRFTPVFSTFLRDAKKFEFVLSCPFLNLVITHNPKHFFKCFCFLSFILLQFVILLQLFLETVALFLNWSVRQHRELLRKFDFHLLFAPLQLIF